jgi:hypothetical protein
MDILLDAVKKLENQTAGSGAEDAIVSLATDPATVYCQFEKGACMLAAYGGRSAEFITSYPVTAKTKIGYMFGSALEKMPQRAAAAAVLNVTTGFFCISRVLRSCNQAMHRQCLAELLEKIGSGTVYPVGLHTNVLARIGPVTEGPEPADVFLIVGDGLISESTGDLIARWRGKKRMLFLGPSTAGLSALEGCDHWCPYGKG